MWFKIKAYLKFLWHCKNQHGIHSPFVYKLITQCFYNKQDLKFTGFGLMSKKEILGSNAILEVEDFGAGIKSF